MPNRNEEVSLNLIKYLQAKSDANHYWNEVKPLVDTAYKNRTISEEAFKEHTDFLLKSIKSSRRVNVIRVRDFLQESISIGDKKSSNSLIEWIMTSEIKIEDYLQEVKPLVDKGGREGVVSDATLKKQQEFLRPHKSQFKTTFNNKREKLRTDLQEIKPYDFRILSSEPDSIKGLKEKAEKEISYAESRWNEDSFERMTEAIQLLNKAEGYLKTYLNRLKTLRTKAEEERREKISISLLITKWTFIIWGCAFGFRAIQSLAPVFRYDGGYCSPHRFGMVWWRAGWTVLIWTVIFWIILPIKSDELDSREFWEKKGCILIIVVPLVSWLLLPLITYLIDLFVKGPFPMWPPLATWSVFGFVAGAITGWIKALNKYNRQNQLWMPIVASIVIFSTSLAMPTIYRSIQKISPRKETLIFAERFDNNQNQWPITKLARIENGKYYIKGQKDRTFIFLERNLKDFKAEVTIRRTKSKYPQNVYGIMFRGTDRENSYYLGFTSKSIGLFKMSSGEIERIKKWTNSDLIPSNSYKHITLLCKEDIIKIYINDRELLVVQDSRFSEGKIGFFVLGYGDEIEVDNLLIYSFDEKEHVAVKPSSPQAAKTKISPPEPKKTTTQKAVTKESDRPRKTEPRKTVPKKAEKFVTVGVSTARIRSEPAMGAKVVAEIPKGTKLPVISSSQGWHKVRLSDGRVGWIYRLLIKEGK